VFNSISYSKLKRAQNLNSLVQEREMLKFCFSNLGRGIDMRFFVDALFENYSLFRSSVQYFHRVPEVLD